MTEKRAKFTQMKDGDAEDYSIIAASNAKDYDHLADKVLTHLKMLENDYGGFQVDRLTHSNGSIVQGGFVTGMLDASMAQCIMFKSNGEDLPLTLDIDVKFLNSCIPDHKVTSRAKIIKQGKSIVFTTANLFQRDDLIATASASNKIIKFKF